MERVEAAKAGILLFGIWDLYFGILNIKHWTMNHDVHIALQIVPITRQPAYPIIDKAIEVIKQSGVKFQVGPMETVMQGDYDTIMAVAKRAQQACMDAGADEVVVTMKVHARKTGDVSWEEKNLDRFNL